MSYTPKVWTTGETITADKMNNIEQGIQEAMESGGSGGGGANISNYTDTITTTWSGTSAPYTQAMTINGILSTDTILITPVYSTNNDTAIQQQTAWNLISKAEASANRITFTCFDDKPTVAIPISIGVIR